MNNKTCLVTGATDGIGKATALELARKGATVIIVGRNRTKGEVVVSEIKSQTRNDRVELMVADLSSQAEVRQLAEACQRQHPVLDVLVNNAGGYFMQRQVSAEGIEMTWALNHLSYFLLTHRLLDTLKLSASARIINVSSDAHEGGTINFDDVQGTQSYRGFGAYSQSKLANVLFTYELARQLEGSHVTANVLHPGLVRTQFGHNNGVVGKIVMPLIQLFAVSPQQGAQTSIYLASSPEVANVSGKYFVKSRPAKSSAASYDTAAAQRLWEVSAAMTGVRVM